MSESPAKFPTYRLTEDDRARLEALGVDTGTLDAGDFYLLETRQMILAAPRNFDMSDWIIIPRAQEAVDLRTIKEDPYQCGALMCIAGWVALLSDEDQRITLEERDTMAREWYMHGAEKRAREVLGLTDDDLLGDQLFQADSWPDPFAEEFEEAANNVEQAHVAARRIDHFIAYRE